MGSLGQGGAAFLTTHWSVVLTAQGRSPEAREALDQLCRSYWLPLYAFVRREGHSPEEAQDLTRGFRCGPAGEGAVAFLPAGFAEALSGERAPWSGSDQARPGRKADFAR